MYDTTSRNLGAPLLGVKCNGVHVLKLVKYINAC